MSFAILRVEKIKTQGAIASIGKHNERERETPNADYNITPENKTLVGDDSLSYLEAWQEKTKDLKIRSNAVLALEVVLTYSPEAKIQQSQNFEAWQAKNIQFLKDTFGEDNILKAKLHIDETTPHIHAVIVPIDDKGKLNARAFTGGREKLRDMQTNYAEYMQDFKLNRGIENSRAEHIPLKKFYGAMQYNKITQEITAEEVQPKIIKKTFLSTHIETDETVAKRINERIKPDMEQARIYKAFNQEIKKRYNILENLKNTYHKIIDIFKGLKPEQVQELSKQADKMREQNREQERQERQRKREMEKSKGYSR